MAKFRISCIIAALLIFTAVLPDSAFAVPPTVSMTPTSGSCASNQAVTFTTVITDTAGYADIQYAHVNVNNGIGGVGGFLGYYVRASNLFYVMNEDAGWIGGYAPGSANVIETPSVKLNCALSSASASGTTLTVTWNVIFKSPCVGTKDIWVLSADNQGQHNGWAYIGSWTITQANNPPVIASLNPATGSAPVSQQVSFSTRVRDADGSGDLQNVLFNVNNGISGVGGFLGYYIKASNALYVMNESNGWIGGYAPGSAHVIDTPSVQLNCAQTNVTTNGTNMTIVWNTVFKSPSIGAKSSYLLVNDNAGGTSGWQYAGNWTVLPSSLISYGQTVYGSINAANETDSYTFNGTSGEMIAVRFAKTAGTLAPRIDVYNPANVSIGFSTSGRFDKILNVTGTFSLKLRDSGNTKTGGYAVSLQRLITPVGGMVLNFGQCKSSSVGAVSGVAAFMFNATSADTIALRWSATAGNLTPRLELYAPNGTNLISTISKSIDRVMNASGTYTVLVTDSTLTNVGPFSLSAQRVNNPGNGIPVTFGQTVTDDIYPYADISSVTFNATANDTVFIRPAIVSLGTTSFTPYLELYSPAGAKAATAINNDIIQKLNATGTYTLLLTDSGYDAPGTYEVTVQRTNNPGNVTVLPFNTTMNGTLVRLSGLSVYRINATAAGPISICNGITSTSYGSLSLGMALFAPNGTRMAYTSASSLRYTMQVAGNWHLMFYDWGSDGTGSFRFNARNANVTCSGIDFAAPLVNTTRPLAGDVVENNATYQINWNSTDSTGVTSQEIRLSTDSGVSFPTLIAGNLSGTAKVYNWSVPANLSSAQARMKISAWDAAGNRGDGITPADFVIVKTVAPANATNFTYAYDKENRLTNSTGSNYTFDALGNRLNLN